MSAPAAVPNVQKPSDFLKNVLGRVVIVKLNSGVTYRGARSVLTPPHLFRDPRLP